VQGIQHMGINAKAEAQ